RKKPRVALDAAADPRLGAGQTAALDQLGGEPELSRARAHPLGRKSVAIERVQQIALGVDEGRDDLSVDFGVVHRRCVAWLHPHGHLSWPLADTSEKGQALNTE